MKIYLTTIINLLLFTITNAQNNEEYYKNIKGELKPLSEIIEDAQRSIAINEFDIPYLTYTSENLFKNPEGRTEQGIYFITTEVNKIKSNNVQQFKIRTIVYFQSTKNKYQSLLNFYSAITNDLNQNNLYKKINENNLLAKNLICASLENLEQNQCDFEEYWGD